MSKFLDSVVTEQGALLQTIKPTRIAVGDGAAADNLEEYTELINEIQRFDLIANGLDGGEFWAVAHVDAAHWPPSSAPTDFYLREIGLYVADEADPDNREADILYAVSVVDNGYITYMPSRGSVGWFRILMRAVILDGVKWLGQIKHEDLEAYTPLDVFQPVQRDNNWYGEHRHAADTVDGLEGAGWQVGDIRFLSYKLPEAPQGDYMLCDGREINLAEYPELFKGWAYDYEIIDSGEGE